MKNNQLFQMELLRVVMQLKNNMLDIISPITHEHGLSLLETLVLFSISEEHDLTIGDVYKSMNLNQGNLSTMCKKLEEKGYLVRTRNKNDQRTVILEITEKGEEALNEINKKIDKLYKVVEKIPKDKVKKAVEGLKCFSDIIEEIHSKKDE